MTDPLRLGLSETPPRRPWGINFGGGLNSTAVILECIERCYRPDWILFADTGSEYPGTLEHVDRMRQLVAFERPDWPEVVTVRWERIKGDVTGFEPLHENCLRTNHLPSKAYGYAGCTMKWKVQPMERWRKARGFQQGAFAVGYDAGEHRRIKSACQRGDDPKFTAWYPLVAWEIDRNGCQATVDRWGIKVGKSSCWMCPNMRTKEWMQLRDDHPELWDLACKIEDKAAESGNFARSGQRLALKKIRDAGDISFEQTSLLDQLLDDRCHHGGCFT